MKNITIAMVVVFGLLLSAFATVVSAQTDPAYCGNGTMVNIDGQVQRVEDWIQSEFSNSFHTVRRVTVSPSGSVPTITAVLTALGSGMSGSVLVIYDDNATEIDRLAARGVMTYASSTSAILSKDDPDWQRLGIPVATRGEFVLVTFKSRVGNTATVIDSVWILNEVMARLTQAQNVACMESGDDGLSSLFVGSAEVTTNTASEQNLQCGGIQTGEIIQLSDVPQTAFTLNREDEWGGYRDYFSRYVVGDQLWAGEDFFPLSDLARWLSAEHNVTVQEGQVISLHFQNPQAHRETLASVGIEDVPWFGSVFEWSNEDLFGDVQLNLVTINLYQMSDPSGVSITADYVTQKIAPHWVGARVAYCR